MQRYLFSAVVVSVSLVVPNNDSFAVAADDGSPGKANRQRARFWIPCGTGPRLSLSFKRATKQRSSREFHQLIRELEGGVRSYRRDLVAAWPRYTFINWTAFASEPSRSRWLSKPLMGYCMLDIRSRRPQIEHSEAEVIAHREGHLEEIFDRWLEGHFIKNLRRSVAAGTALQYPAKIDVSITTHSEVANTATLDDLARALKNLGFSGD